MKRWLLIFAPLLLFALTACGSSDDSTPRPTEIRVITGEPQVQSMQSTIDALETSQAQIVAQASGVPVGTSVTIALGVVTGGDAIVLAEPDPQADELGILPQGTQLNILGQSEPNRIGIVFYNIQFEALNGWVASTQVELEETTSVAANPTQIPTEAATAGPSSTPTITLTASRTPSPQPTATFPPTATPTITPTPLPAGFPTPEIYSVVVVEELFERGRMIWFQPIRQVWVLVGDTVDPTSGTWSCYLDEFVDGMPERDPNLDPPQGTTLTTDFEGAIPIQPIRGFGRIWREQPDVRQGLGWAITYETMHTTRYEYNAGGEVKNGRYSPAAGTYEVDSFFQQTLILEEDSVKAPCDTKTGTWRLK